MTKDINKIYRNILETAWMTANDKGIISRLTDPESGEKVTVLVEDNTDNQKKKTLVLPLKENLVGLNTEEFLVMHPLAENPSKPASPVVDFIRRMMLVRVNWVLSTMIPELLVFVANPVKHDLLAPEQYSLLTTLTDVDKNSAAKFLKLIEASTKKYGHFATMVSVHLARGGVVNGKSYHRAAIVKFTLYDELVKADTDNVVLGVKLTKKERELFKKLFEYVIPGIDDAKIYNTGSNTSVAPFMDSLMNTFLKLFSATNVVVENYEVVFSVPKLMTVPLNWSDDLIDIDNLASVVRLIPPQRGNEGDQRVEDKLRSENEANVNNFKSTATADASGNNFRPQPLPEVVTPTQSQGTISFNSIAPTVAPTTVLPWENNPPAVTGFNQNNQSQSNGRVSFSNFLVAQPTQNFNNQQRGPAFGGGNNFSNNSRSGF